MPKAIFPLSPLNTNASNIEANKFEVINNTNHYYSVIKDSVRIGHPTVSVIMTAYNSSRHIMKALQAVLNERRRDIEIVIVDDASCDDTISIAMAIANENSNILIAKTINSLGATKTRELGFSLSRGAYIWFVDPDDAWEPNALEIFLEHINAADVDVVNCIGKYVYSNGQSRLITKPEGKRAITGRDAFTLLLSGAIKGHLWTKLISRRVLDNIEFPNIKVHSDLAMVGQILANSKNVVLIDDVLYYYKLRPGSVITTPKSRYESLILVEDILSKMADKLSLSNGMLYSYFQQRFIVLSQLKDAWNGPYDSDKKIEMIRKARKRIKVGGIIACFFHLDFKRALALTTSKLFSHGYKLIQRFA